MRELNEIIVHCSATRPAWWSDKNVLQKVSEFRRWHTDKGWRDIGYHFVVDRDGSVAPGRAVSQQGAHVKGRNRGTIGICLVGGHGSSDTDAFSENFTPEQDAALRKLIADLRQQYGDLAISGHNQWSAKACPGFFVPTWFEGAATRKIPTMPPEVRKVVEDANKAPTSSTSFLAVIMGFAGSGYAWWQAADTETRVAITAVVLMLLYIGRERLRKIKLGRVAKEALGL